MLNPPTTASAVNSDTFSFKATSANSEPEFLGFEVYYRIYAVEDSPAIYYNSFAEMSTAGFKRLYDPQWAPGDSDLRFPLVAPAPADHGSEYQITIDFNVPDSASYPQLSSIGLTTPILMLAVRRAVASTIEYKKFQKSSFSPGETDLTALAYNSISADNPVNVLMFAVSYGFDPVNEEQVYSLPVLIGNEEFIIRTFS